MKKILFGVLEKPYNEVLLELFIIYVITICTSDLIIYTDENNTRNIIYAKKIIVESQGKLVYLSEMSGITKIKISLECLELSFLILLL